jgi:predicted nucleic acid-binding protein
VNVVFADTSYWIALINPREALHTKAAALARKFAPSQVVTSEMVCVEFLNSFSSAGSHLRAAAVALVVALRQSRSGLVWPQSPEQFQKAVLRYAQVKDKDWSLTDCASFEIMESEGIYEALTSDRHFAQAGFSVLLV